MGPAYRGELGIFATFAGTVSEMAFALDGKTLLLGGGPTIGLALWSVAERREISPPVSHPGSTRCPLRGLFLVVPPSPLMAKKGSRSKQKESEFGMSTPARKCCWAVRSSIDYYHPALAPDGRFVAADEIDIRRPDGTTYCAVHLWELPSGQEVARLEITRGTGRDKRPHLFPRRAIPGRVLQSRHS